MAEANRLFFASRFCVIRCDRAMVQDVKLPRLHLRPDHMRFMVDEMALGQVFL